MKRKFSVIATATLLSFAILSSSCIGSFSLSKKLLVWNQNIDNNKWLNELVFLALATVQAYSITIIVDALVLNSIEFWTGENPAVNAQIKQVETEKGVFAITTDENGHTIQKEGSDEIVEFRFDKEENSWALVMMGESTPLLQFVGENQAKVYLADGSTMTVSLDQAGVLAFQQAVNNKAFFAAK
jgi:hypothetical protein